MHARVDREQALLAKIRDLPDGHIDEVEDFVDFLRARDEQRKLVQTATALSEPSLAAVWDNPEDDVYNAGQTEPSAVPTSRRSKLRRQSDKSGTPTTRSFDEAGMSTQQRDVGSRLDRIYEHYVKPVEQDHLGEYVLVTPAGEMIFASSQSELIKRTEHIRGTDNCLFKVGEIAATKIL